MKGEYKMINLKKLLKQTMEDVSENVADNYGDDALQVMNEFFEDLESYDFEESFKMCDIYDQYSYYQTRTGYEDLEEWYNEVAIEHPDLFVEHFLEVFDNEDTRCYGMESVLTEVQCRIRYAGFDNNLYGLIQCIVATYLIQKGYAQIEEDVFGGITADIDDYYSNNLTEIFTEVLSDLGYDEDNCGTKAN